MRFQLSKSKILYHFSKKDPKKTQVLPPLNLGKIENQNLLSL